MQDPKRTKDESVQAGLEIAGHHPTDKGRQMDPDDLVHEQPDEVPDPLEEQDVDDLLHDKDGGEG